MSERKSQYEKFTHQQLLEMGARRYEAVRQYKLRGAKSHFITTQLLQLQTGRDPSTGRVFNDSGQHDYFPDVSERAFDNNYRLVRKAAKQWADSLEKVVEAATPHAKGTLVERLEMVINEGMRAWSNKAEPSIIRAKGFDKALEAMVRVARVLGVDVDMKLDVSFNQGNEDPAEAAARAIRDWVAKQQTASEQQRTAPALTRADDGSEEPTN